MWGRLQLTVTTGSTSTTTVSISMVTTVSINTTTVSITTVTTVSNDTQKSRFGTYLGF